MTNTHPVEPDSGT